MIALAHNASSLAALRESVLCATYPAGPFVTVSRAIFTIASHGIDHGDACGRVVYGRLVVWSINRPALLTCPWPDPTIDKLLFPNPALDSLSSVT